MTIEGRGAMRSFGREGQAIPVSAFPVHVQRYTTTSTTWDNYTGTNNRIVIDPDWFTDFDGVDHFELALSAERRTPNDTGMLRVSNNPTLTCDGSTVANFDGITSPRMRLADVNFSNNGKILSTEMQSTDGSEVGFSSVVINCFAVME